MEAGEPETKKFKHSIISEHMFESEFQEIFCKHWHERTPIKTPEIEVIAEPFRVCRITNFLKDEEFMDEIKNELLDVKSRRNSIDLYQFEQSNDLAKADSENLKTLYQTFQTDMATWLEKNTKIDLNKTVSMSSSCYSDTDYLLCHDDNLADRRIAFILYLSKNWTEEDGGALDLFDTDENGLPRDVVKSLMPEYNSIVFFEVVNNSYHQVAEVTSADKSRWSLNGWFHGPIAESERPERPRPIINYYTPEPYEVDLEAWVSKIYLFPGIIQEIQEDVEQDSYAFLSNFLNADVYEKLSEELKSENIRWKKAGPADIRNYEVAEEDSLPETLGNFYKIFKSLTVCQLLKEYTELDLVPDRNIQPKMTIELQRWSKGCYTLMSDKFSYEQPIPTPTPALTVNDAASSTGDASTTPAVTTTTTTTTATTTATEKKPSTNTETSDPEIVGESSTSSQISRLPSNNYSEESDSRNKNLSEEAGCNTPPSSTGDDELDDDDEGNTSKHTITDDRSPKPIRATAGSSCSSQQQASPSKLDTTPTSRPRRNFDSDRSDSEVSDIGDYLSDPLDCSFDCSEQEDEGEAEDDVGAEADADADGEADDEDAEAPEPEEPQVPGTLDVIMQFHTDHVPDDMTIDYLNGKEVEAALAHVPSKDNHLCLVYRNLGTSRVHKYVNHYFKGHFYNLICTYWE